MKMRTAGAAVAVALAGCATTGNSSTVRPATLDQVQGCQYIDDVIGSSGWYGVFARQGSDNARADAFGKAASLGATHLVWSPLSARHGSTDLSGKAYKCS